MPSHFAQYEFIRWYNHLDTKGFFFVIRNLAVIAADKLVHIRISALQL